MKNLIVIFILMFAIGCSDYLDVNVDPNNPSDVDPTLVLPSAEAQIAASLSGQLAPLTGIWSQHWTQSNAASQFRDEDRYALTNSDYQTFWTNLYSDGLVDLDFIRSSAVESGNWNANLQAVSLMAYTYQILTDLYGDIPFSEALKGTEGVLSPKFDSGTDIYDQLIIMIDNALAQDFGAATNVPIGTDFLFGSTSASAQSSNWIKFANTLKLKIYLRQTKARPSVAEAGIKALLAENNFLNEGVGISVYENAPDRSYPLYEAMVRQLNVATNLRASHTLMSYLLDNSDARVDVLFAAGSGGHFGLPQGAFNTPSTVVDPQAVSYAIFDPSNTWYFFATDEIKFMLAEANLRYGSGAKSFYDQGVISAFARLGLDGSANLAGSYAYPNGSFEENLEAIIMQKWVASVERGHESFFDINRTGIPKVSNVPTSDVSYVSGQRTYSVTGTTNGQFPQRL
ncbi:MAG: SusD/RagB family nutrient-binding outer membrane lipoprotein, partial [Saprospiraceae bacterium]